jgi:hypothetical protein
MKVIAGGESGGVPAFCGQCGAPAQGAPFCQNCGAKIGDPAATVVQVFPQDSRTPDTLALAGDASVSAQAAQPTSPQSVTTTAQTMAVSGPNTPPVGTPAVMPTPTKPPTGKDSKRIWLIGGAAAVVVIAIAVVATLLLTGNTKHGLTYNQQAAEYIAPVLADNQKIVAMVTLLSPGGNPDGLKTLIASTQSDTQVAQQLINGLTPTASDDLAATNFKGALTSEAAWLLTATTVLSNTSSPLLSQLSGIGLDAQNKLEALGEVDPAAAHTAFPSSAQIVSFASAANTSAQATQENTAFSNQVLALLNQSAPMFQAVNSLYAQLQTAADGGYTDLTLPQAEQQINSIVASRTSLAAAAQALSAPTPEAETVSADLVTAFNDSLKDDNDLATCLNEENFGTFAFISQGCLSASSSDNTTATSDKQTFLTAYNQLRSTVGQPPTSVQF